MTVWSSYEPVLDSICPTLCSNDDVVDSIFVNLIEVDAVYALSDEFSPPLSDTNPNSVICSEPDIVPAGIVSPLLLTNPSAVIWAEPLIKSSGNCSDELIIPLVSDVK